MRSMIMAAAGLLRRATHGFLFLLALVAAGCSEGGLKSKARPDSGDGTCGTMVCSADPPSSSQCSAGRCLTTLASGLNYARQIVVDATAAYWAGDDASLGSVVMAVPLNGGAPGTLVSDYKAISGIAVDGANLYWTNGGSEGTVMKTPLSGGNSVTLASGQYSPEHIAVDATAVYWTTQGPWSGGHYGDGTVMKVPLAGGTPTLLASGGYPWGIAVDSSSVYWIELNLGEVKKVPLGGGAPTTLASFRLANNLAVDATSVYWTTKLREVEKAPLAGGASTPLAELPSPDVLDEIAVDDASVYWVTNDQRGWKVMKMPLAGGAPMTLAEGQGYPWGLAVDATSIYWTVHVHTENADSVMKNADSVMKLTPK